MLLFATRQAKLFQATDFSDGLLDKRAPMALMMLAYTFGSQLVGASVLGGASIPGQWHEITMQHERAEALCRQTSWNLHRAAQLSQLSEEDEKVLKQFYGPATNIAKTSLRNWKMSMKSLEMHQEIYTMNLAVLAITMVVFVALAYMSLFRKRRTLQEAFAAVQTLSGRLK